MEKALEGLRPIAAYGTSPPPGGAGLAVALSRASSAGPLPTAAEANNEDRMTHEQLHRRRRPQHIKEPTLLERCCVP